MLRLSDIAQVRRAFTDPPQPMFRVNGEPATIVGVMPQHFAFPITQEIWVPLRQDRSGDAWGIVYGRMVRARRAAMVILKVPCLCGQPLRNMCVGRARCVVRQNR